MVGRLTLFKMLHCKLKRERQMLVEKEQRRRTLQKYHSKSPRKKDTKMTVKIEPEFEKICRVCLNEGDLPIYGDPDQFSDKTKDLNEFGGIEVRVDDGYPKYLCQTCSELLDSAILLRKTAQKSDLLLKQSKQEIRDEQETDIGIASMIKSDDDFDDDDMVDLKSLAIKVEVDCGPTKKEVKKRTNFFCVRCNLKFQTQDQLQEHRMSDEHENKRVTCSICNQDFKYTSFKSHMLRHEMSSICDICGKECKGQVARHRLTHFYDLPFKCNLCPYRGRSTESVKVHMRSHAGMNMKVKNYHCPECPSRSFINKSNLSRHMLTHKASRDFKCEMCDRGFHLKKELEMHLKVDHTGIREYGCDICGKMFGYKKQLRQHQRKVHKREKLKSGRTPLYVLAEQGEQIG